MHWPDCSACIGDTGETGSIDTGDTDTGEGDTDTGETGTVIDTGDTGIDSGSGEDTADSGDTDTGGDTAVEEDDADGDGYTETDGDCDDDEFYSNPGEVENEADLIDNDCDGNIHNRETFVQTASGVPITYIDDDNVVDDGALVDGVGDWELVNVCTASPYSAYTTTDLTVSDTEYTDTLGRTEPGMEIIATEGNCDTVKICAVKRNIPLTIGELHGVNVLFKNAAATGNGYSAHLGSDYDADPYGTTAGSGSLALGTDELFVGSVYATQAVDDLYICTGSWVTAGTGWFGQVYVGLAVE